jgi:hypothetical protein
MLVVVGTGLLGGALTTNVPAPVAKSVADVEALTVKDVVPPGVAPVVLMVNVAVFESSFDVNSTGFGEKEEGEGLTPVGQDVVGVILKAAVKAPEEPPPLPLFTVIV